MTFSELRAHLTELELIDGVIGTLGWDEQTYMPKAAAELRGAQTALLSKLSHERLTDPRIATWLGQLDASPLEAACARNLGRSYQREKRVSGELVERLAKARSEGFQAWIEAKKNRDFGRFLPVLESLVSLSKERARAIDPARHPYEVMLEQYDPGTSVESLRAMFARLREGLVPLLMAIAERPVPKKLDAPFPEAAQWAFHKEIALALGYDFDGGRIDPAEHPFSTGHARDRARALRAGPPHRALRNDPRRGRLAGRARVAVALLGEPRGPLAVVLALSSTRRRRAFPAALEA
jgi:carboxypeptidase Taq